MILETEPWLEAAKEGRKDAARMLLAEGREVDACDVEGWTALMYAALGGHYETASWLIKKGANVNARSFGGFAGTTPLMIAASCGHEEIVRLLLAHGAEVDFEGPLGGTAVAFATFQGHCAIVRLLKSYGADLSLGNIYGRFC